MSKVIHLEPGCYYHIYNRGINSCRLFREKTNYEHFIRLYERYIPAVAYTYAWVLIPNHFHFLIKVKDLEDIFTLENLCKYKYLSDSKRIDITHRISRQFANLFSSYTKAFNKKYSRTGGLFERSFCRKRVIDEEYLKYLVYYIHHNPVHHNLTEHMVEYPWSSYLMTPSPDKPNMRFAEVIEWFQNYQEYEIFHDRDHDFSILDEVIWH